MLTIIDMHMGNLNSVCHALRHLGVAFRLAQKVRDVEDARALLLPGVGAFGQGMATLRAEGLVEPIRYAVLHRAVPLLGICVGMQILARSGEEFGLHQGLDLIPGQVVPLPARQGLVPHMGWERVCPCAANQDLFPSGAENTFYFAHSYHFQCDDPATQAAVVAWGNQRITAAVRSGPILGVQFHPEKSQDAGLDFLNTIVHRMLDAQR